LLPFEPLLSLLIGCIDFPQPAGYWQSHSKVSAGTWSGDGALALYLFASSRDLSMRGHERAHSAGNLTFEVSDGLRPVARRPLDRGLRSHSREGSGRSLL